MSHVPRMNESCPIFVISAMSPISCLMYEWVTSHIWLSHVPCMNESCSICGQVMSHMCGKWKRRTHLPQRRIRYYCDKLCIFPIYEWVMSHIWIGYASYMNGSCRKYERVMSVLWQEETARTPPPAPHSSWTHLCDMTHSYMGHDVFIWDMRTPPPAPHSSWTLLCDMTHSYMGHNVFIWDMQIPPPAPHSSWTLFCDMTHSLFGTKGIHMGHANTSSSATLVISSLMRHGSFIHGT